MHKQHLNAKHYDVVLHSKLSSVRAQSDFSYLNCTQLIVTDRPLLFIDGTYYNIVPMPAEQSIGVINNMYNIYTFLASNNFTARLATIPENVSKDDGFVVTTFTGRHLGDHYESDVLLKSDEIAKADVVDSTSEFCGLNKPSDRICGLDCPVCDDSSSASCSGEYSEDDE